MSKRRLETLATIFRTQRQYRTLVNVFLFLIWHILKSERENKWRLKKVRSTLLHRTAPTSQRYHDQDIREERFSGPVCRGRARGWCPRGWGCRPGAAGCAPRSGAGRGGCSHPASPARWYHTQGPWLRNHLDASFLGRHRAWRMRTPCSSSVAECRRRPSVSASGMSGRWVGRLEKGNGVTLLAYSLWRYLIKRC